MKFRTHHCNQCGRHNVRWAAYCGSCGTSLIDVSHPRVRVVMRLGGRSPLLPPFVILRNVAGHPVTISSMTLDDQFCLDELIASKLAAPVVLEPGESIHIPAVEFRHQHSRAAWREPDVSMCMPYTLVANGTALSDTTCPWIGQTN